MDDIQLFRILGSISRKATTEMNGLVRDLGLDNNLFLYLLRIAENEGLNQVDLSNLLQIDKTTLSRGLKKLEILGYIEKRTDPENKKYKQLFTTIKGNEAAKAVANLESDYVNSSLKELNQADKNKLAKILSNIS
ncbi:MarR family winged helix-turn-helix transcriptional regulator [Floricoccus penangensis]|uniref:MarR family winged helix-turn-helix transcriptional regulator n=1 Tax=Floricoccus penangensis TaxID=1859475 RepID=UPI00203EE219|nr:MarR family transcriptional regulator [Floricoccus penangensis]URZ88127.1 MarR family transcriptional regulator [Floricoccus penangensis]